MGAWTKTWLGSSDFTGIPDSVVSRVEIQLSRRVMASGPFGSAIAHSSTYCEK